MVGMLVSGGGYEDMKFQAELCTAVSLKEILSGNHCNQTWLVNGCFAEAVDLLFHEKYVILVKPLEVKVKVVTERDSEDMTPI